MAEATLRSGCPETIDYTPSGGNVSAGQVVLLGNTAGLACGIAVRDITNNTLGSLAVHGGVWKVTTGVANIAAYSKVYWDDTNNKITNTSTNMAPFGYVLAVAAVNTAVDCFFHPEA